MISFKCKTVLILLTSVLSVSAQQKLEWGIKAGAGQSQFTRVDDPKGKLYFNAGTLFAYPVTSLIDMNAEVLLSSGGSGYFGVQERDATLGFNTDQAYEGDVRVYSIEVPVYPSLNLGSHAYQVRLYGGVAMNFNWLAYESRDYRDPAIVDSELDLLDRVDPLSFALVYGVMTTLQWGEDKWLLGLRLSNGLSGLYVMEFNILQPEEAKMNYISLSVGYIF